MKINILFVGSALMLLSTSAFATKARLQALGEDKDGSYYISDSRNIFINPSELNSMGNKAILEWGNTGTAYQGASLDLDTNPKAEGGVLYSLSNGLKIGAMMGDETDVAALTRMLASNVYGTTVPGAQFMQTADNVLDVFVAGKAGVNWGANLLYTASKNESGTASHATKHDQHAYAARVGLSDGPWNVHLLVPISAQGDAPDLTFAPTYKGKFGGRLGGGYNLSDTNKLFGMYETYSWKQANTQDAERVGSYSKGILGIGHNKKVSDSSTFICKAQVEVTNINLDAVGAKVQAKISRVALPLTVGFEHSALDWLVVRGSVVQNIYGTVDDSGLHENFGDYTLGATDTGKVVRYLAAANYGASSTGNGGKKTLSNSTKVNAGATLKFGSVEVDGNIGASSATRTDTSPTSTTVGSNTNKGVLGLDNLETRVGLTYNF
jgi:hypothetical protein